MDKKAEKAVLDDNTRRERRKTLVKNLLIVFLAAMLILTFFSNTIMNRALAEIKTQRAVPGRITETVRIYGTVEASQTVEIKTDDIRTIEKINIRAGQKVAEGDILFVLGSDSSDGLSTEEELLSEMETAYQKSLLTVPTDYSSENQEIRNAAEDLEMAIKRRDAAYAAKASAERGKTQYNSDRADAAALTAERDKLIAAIAAADGDDIASAAPELVGDLAALLRDWRSAEEEYSEAYAVYAKAAEGGDAQSALADCAAKDEKRSAAKAAYDSEKSCIRAVLVQKLSEAEAKLDDVNSRIASYEASAQTDGMSPEDCDADVTAKQRNLERLRTELAKTQSINDTSARSAAIDLEAQREKLEKQRRKVEELRAGSEKTDIVSKYNGVVRSVDVQLESLTSAGVPLAVIDVAQDSYTIRFDAEAEKAQKIKKGTQAEVLNGFSGDEKAVLISTEQSSLGAAYRTLVFEVTGTVSPGAVLELNVPISARNYDTIVPKSAVYSDKEGSFVYKVRSRNSPLGNRYFVQRVSVDVLASDNTSCAVSGELGGSDSVITAFSKPVSSGDQVRLSSDD